MITEKDFAVAELHQSAEVALEKIRRYNKTRYGSVMELRRKYPGIMRLHPVVRDEVTRRALAWMQRMGEVTTPGAMRIAMEYNERQLNTQNPLQL